MSGPDRFAPLEEIARLARIAAANATQADPGVFPGSLFAAGINPRDPVRNSLLGTTYSNYGDTRRIVIGVAYDDRQDGHTDEDHFRIDLPTGRVEDLSRGRLERELPVYRGSHRGPKDYLR